MISLLIIYVIIIGAVLGSFVTALVHRKKHGWSMLAKRSVCPHCQKPLKPKHLLPIVSYIWQRGVCGFCGKPIGRRYILTELASVALFLSLAGFLWQQFMQLSSVEWWWAVLVILFMLVVGVLLLALFVYDWQWGELPNSWTLSLAGLSFLMFGLAWLFDLPVVWQPQFEHIQPTLVGSVASGLIAAAFFYVIVWLSEVVLRRPGMGMGDVKLVLGLGFFLGFPATIVALYIAFVLGAVVSLLLIASKRQGMGTTIAFGPFLIVGWLASLWIAPAIIEWYFSLWL